MFKVAVKHYIYDFCINLIFKRIRSNFNQTRSTNSPKIGEFYSRVSHVENDEHYHNCIVRDLEWRINKSNEKYLLVYISYEHCNGDIFDEDDWIEEELNNYFDKLDEEELREIERDLQEAGSKYKEWHDDESIESIQFDDILCIKFNFYSFYK